MVGQDSGQVSQTQSHAPEKPRPLGSHAPGEATPFPEVMLLLPQTGPMTKLEFMTWGGLVRESYCYRIVNKNLNSTFIWR